MTAGAATCSVAPEESSLIRRYYEIIYPQLNWRRRTVTIARRKKPGTFPDGCPSRAQRMIKTEHLTKRYHALTAVEDVSFQVGPGEVLGFLGPNGAGKTTTMRMLAGFVTPTSGSASICGHDVVTDALAAKACLGYLPEGAPSYGEMTVLGFLGFIADVRGLS